ncbi:MULTISPECIES: hypothetical protein [unclassified Cupriavidus]|uniref:hypothetical protein n=1 Tax=unclassified Cupriavidus TaxID=2640874 RepID=UPI001BFFFFE5|nr:MULTISPECIES: hypothetical protein [unclassified Cupriavidus]MCA3190971.1 hypothetical protein [Cupriavidus sp.]MCA3199315.1 hypothetical protein [Cupriavidus sp.]MCA3204582.1 hypothetical protein [Cupriavidus sp.]MCA3209049.1 hypothetical protein [Cupriavidus sp.]MCA3231573.1 hypothetical protein [Cupriavidus sp.]
MPNDYTFMSAISGKGGYSTGQPGYASGDIQRADQQYISEDSRAAAAIAIANTPGLAQKVGYVGHGLSAAAAQQVAQLEGQKAGYTRQGAGASLVIDEAYPPGHPLRKRWVSHGCR